MDRSRQALRRFALRGFTLRGFTTRATVTAVTAGLLIMLSPGSKAQAPDPAPGTGAVLGTGIFTSFVENMDQSLAFYHDAFGLEVPAIPESGARPYNASNPRLFEMFAIPGARERHQSARVPGSPVAIELMEIQNAEHSTLPLRLQDPGTATLVLGVRDIAATLARAVQAGATVVTPGNQPVISADGGRAVLIRDRDRRPIELRQAPSPGATGHPIVDMGVSIAVADLDRTVAVYRDVLGFRADEVKRVPDAAVLALTGLDRAGVRRSRIQAPGSMLPIELVEYNGVPRTPQVMRIQDRGAARLQLRAQNLDALVTAMKAAGFRVVSAGGNAVPIPPNLKGALVADPNNFFLTPFAPCDGCAPTLSR